MKNVLIIGATTFLLLCALELLSFFSLPKDQQARLFLKHNQSHQPHRFDHRSHYQHDMMLGWAHEGEDEVGHFINGDKNNKKAFRLMILGGSTTDQRVNPLNWPGTLQQIFQKNQMDVVIYNAATAGYSSSQEALKLFRDIHIINPDLVISLNGVNELTGVEVPGHPYLTQHLLKFYKSESNILPNTTAFIRKLMGNVRFYLGPKSDLSQSQIWLQNHKKMHALSQAFDAKYLGILQAHLWSADSEADNPSHLNDKNLRLEDFRRMYSRFYPQAKKHANEVEFIHDGTSFLKDYREYFTDDCHLDTQGNQILAQKIYDVLVSRELIPKD